MFNDDLQGTGAVALAAVMGVCKIKREKLSEQTFVLFGAGTAGLGIAARIRDSICLTEGVSMEEAVSHPYLYPRWLGVLE